MKKIAVITATRAEYGLLSKLVTELRRFEGKSFQTHLVVTGTHLSEAYGNTVAEIERDGHRIDYKIPISVSSSSPMDISDNQAEALVKFTDLFLKEKYDGIVLLGDRYETLAFAIAAGNTNTPVFHLCGGDTTEGAIDEWIRHSITKISALHFVTNEDSKRRVIQLGENPNNVFNYGSTSVDNIISIANMTKHEALQSIGMQDCKYAVCTYHPVTMERACVSEQMEHFLNVIKKTPELQFIVTKSNADMGGAEINSILDEAADKIDNLHIFTSLGIRRYLSLMKWSEFVMGNSSSGIIETPIFKIPTINIGNRQRGRLQVKSIINCNTDEASIKDAINIAMGDSFRKMCKTVKSPYGDGCAAENIAKKIHEQVLNNKVEIMKKFFDLEERN